MHQRQRQCHPLHQPMEQVHPWWKTGAAVSIVPLTFGREASTEYEPCRLAQFFATPYRTVCFFLVYLCRMYSVLVILPSLLIVLKYSRVRATWPGPCPLVLCMYQLMEAGGVGDVGMGMLICIIQYLCTRVLLVSSVYTSIPERAYQEASHHPLVWKGKTTFLYSSLTFSEVQYLFTFILTIIKLANH